MTNPNIERLLREIARQQDADEAYLLDRIEKLEQLVRYMYRCYVQGHDWGVWGAPEQQWVEERMEQLGLLEVDNEEAR